MLHVQLNDCSENPGKQHCIQKSKADREVVWIILIHGEVKVEATHYSPGHSPEHTFSSLFLTLSYVAFYLAEECNVTSSHFWFFSGIQNSFLARKKKRTIYFFSLLLLALVHLRGPWPSGQPMLHSSHLPRSPPRTSVSLWEEWEGWEEKCLPCMHPWVILTATWEEIVYKSTLKMKVLKYRMLTNKCWLQGEF